MPTPVTAAALAAALLATTLPSAALALTCSEPDLAAAVRRAAEAPEPYAILLGTLIPTGDEVQVGGPPAGESVDPNSFQPVEATSFTMQARFEGRRLGTWGFREAEPDAVVMERVCDPGISSCPSFDDLTHREGLLIVRVTDGGYRVQADACRPNVFPDPSRRDLRVAYDCAFGRDCPVRGESR